MEKARCKLLLSFLWTNALVAGALVFLFFSFIDPAEIAVALMLDVDEGLFRIKSYIFGFVFIWIIFNASTFLNCYFSSLRQEKNLQS